MGLRLVSVVQAALVAAQLLFQLGGRRIKSLMDIVRFAARKAQRDARAARTALALRAKDGPGGYGSDDDIDAAVSGAQRDDAARAALASAKTLCEDAGESRGEIHGVLVGQRGVFVGDGVLRALDAENAAVSTVFATAITALARAARARRRVRARPHFISDEEW